MSVKFDANITQKVMYDFLLFHTYTHVMGILAAVFGLVNLTLAVHAAVNGGTGALTYLLFGLVFLLGMPGMLWFTAGSNVRKVPMFHKPVTYELNEEGVLVSQDEKSTLLEWSALMRIASTKRNIFIYQAKNSAIVLPRADLGEQDAAAIEIITARMDPAKVKIRR